MSNKDVVSPWAFMETRPPCTISYHFTLLDVSKTLRFCCHGSQSFEAYESLNEQWNDPAYDAFRRKWHENYSSNKGLCVGCPHHEENKRFGRIVLDYLDAHDVNLNDLKQINEGPE